MTITVVVDAAILPEAVQRGAQTILDDPLAPSPGWSGIDQRVRKNTRRPRTFQIGYGIRDRADRQKIYDLYMTNGQLVGFLFRDPADYTLVNQTPVGTVNGTNRSFFAQKTYTNDAARTYTRRITRLVAATVSVTVGGSPTAFFTLGPLGEILFDVGHAPAGAVLISANYLLAVHYAGKLAFRYDTLMKVSVPTAMLEELFEV
jgi:uncharacterized protein (TIGR02217 family)